MVDYKKEIKKYEALGAKRFQKVVFYIEEKKWNFIKKYVPNYIKFIDKRIERKRKKELKKATTDEEIREANDNAIARKMSIRREYHRNENINYHINSHEQSMFIKQLEWNKEIHRKGLTSDLLFLPASVLLTIHNPIFGLLLGYISFSAFINFECINIQNYNICRLKKIEEILKKREAKEIKRKMDNYSNAFEVMTNTISKENDIPEDDKIVDNIKTIEQAKELKQFLIEMQKERTNEQNLQKAKLKGKK